MAGRGRTLLAGHRRRHLRLLAASGGVVVHMQRARPVHRFALRRLRGGRSAGQTHPRRTGARGGAVFPLRRDRGRSRTAGAALRRASGHRHRAARNRRRRSPRAHRRAPRQSRLRRTHGAFGERRAHQPRRAAPRPAALRPRKWRANANLRPAIPTVRHRHEHGGGVCGGNGAGARLRRDGVRSARPTAGGLSHRRRVQSPRHAGRRRAHTRRRRLLRGGRLESRSAHRRHGLDGGPCHGCVLHWRDGL